MKNKTLTARELNENLVGVLDKCTLYNFLSSINVFINYLRCPEEELGHIRIFAGVTEKPRRLRGKICEALRIASEIRREGEFKKKQMMLLTPLLQLLHVAAVAVARKQDKHFWPKLNVSLEVSHSISAKTMFHLAIYSISQLI